MIWLILLTRLAGASWEKDHPFLMPTEDELVSADDSPMSGMLAMPWRDPDRCLREYECDPNSKLPLCDRRKKKCSGVPDYMQTIGECSCMPNRLTKLNLPLREGCGIEVIKTIVNTTVSECYRTCDATSTCEAFQAEFKRIVYPRGNAYHLTNCILLGLDDAHRDHHGNGLIGGNGRQLKYPDPSNCFSKAITGSQCMSFQNAGCALSFKQEQFCCPNHQDGINLACCEYSPREIVFGSGKWVIISIVAIAVWVCRSCGCGADPSARQTGNSHSFPELDKLKRIAVQHREWKSSTDNTKPDRGTLSCCICCKNDRYLWDMIDGLRESLRSYAEAEVCIIAFINPGSGDQSGAELPELIKELMTIDNDSISRGKGYILTNDEQRKAGIEDVKRMMGTEEQGKTLRVLACGGDGTVTWILSEFERLLQHDKIPPVGIIPCGTGNDLARSLGWGPGVTDTSEYVRLLRAAIEADVVWLDQWKISLRPKNNYPPCLQYKGDSGQAYGKLREMREDVRKHIKYFDEDKPPPLVTALGDSDQKIYQESWRKLQSCREKDEGSGEQRQSYPTFEGYFQNYFSLGMDAKTTYEVDQARKAACGKLCFRTRCPLKPCRWIHGGLLCYLANAPNPLRCMCCKLRAVSSDLKLRIWKEPRDLDQSADVMADVAINYKKDETEEHIEEFPCEVNQFTLTNLNSYGAGMLLYGNTPSEKYSPNDNKIEVFYLNGPIHTAAMTLGKKVTNIGTHCGCNFPIRYQASKLEMTLKEGQYFQMDGEPWVLNNGCTAEITRNKQVKMLLPHNDEEKRPEPNGGGRGIWTGNQKRDFWEEQLEPAEGRSRESQRHEELADPSSKRAPLNVE